MNVDFTATELSLIAAAVNDRIASLDAAAAHITAERIRLALPVADDETVGLLIRSVYAGIARRLEQRLDVPFMDSEEARSMLVVDGVVVVAVGG